MATSTTTATEQLQLIADLTRRRDELELEVGQHQMETARRVRTANVRRCGRCRCPGHTRGRCRVFIPSRTHYMDIPDGAATERAQLRLDAIQVREIREPNGWTPITRYEALTEWVNRPDTDSEAISSSEMTGARNENSVARRRLDAALARVHAQDSTPVRQPVVYLPHPPVIHSGGFTLEELEQTIQYNRHVDVARRLDFNQATPSAPPRPPVVEQPSELHVATKPVEEITCAICLEDLTDCNKTITACGHQYHTNCLMRCMRTTDKCPTCRKPVM